MKNFNTDCHVIGSSALKSDQFQVIIEFPSPPEEDLPTSKRANPFDYILKSFSALKGKVYHSEMIQELLNGTIQGKPFGNSKPWQAVIVGCFLFAVAIGSIYIGR